MIIDFHTHCFPDDLAPKAVTSFRANTGLKMYSDGTSSGLTQAARVAGIDRSVVQPIATKPGQTEKINRWALAIQSDTLICFGTLHPHYAGWRQEIRWLQTNGFRGIKMHPEYQSFYVDDPKLFPLYEAVFAANLAILFHAGEDAAYRGPWHCTPERLARVLDAFPGGTIIAAHMGGYRFWDDVENHLLGRSLVLDTSFSLRRLGRERLTDMMRRHGMDKIVFGSDAPWTDQKRELEGILSLDLNQQEMEQVTGDNAAKLLGLSNNRGET